MRKRLLLVLAAVAVISLVGLGLWLPPLSRIGVGYTAQQTCACLFVSRRTADSCRRDLEPMARWLIKVEIGASEVTARSLGLARARARYEKGFGCGLLE